MIKRLLAALVVLTAACSDGGVVGGGTTVATPSSGAPPATDIWHPAPGTTWQWQLSGQIDESYDVEMYDIDLFEVSGEVIDRLHADGRIVVCYFSAGSVESWRPDAGRFPDEVIGEPLGGWSGERWLDVRALDTIGPVLEARLDLAVARGCDGVEPDNVDAHRNGTGFAITAADQLAFNRWLADAAHERGLSVGLKNDLAQVAELVGWFDWVLVEECVEYDECDRVEPFVSAGKAAFGTEYSVSYDVACPAAAEAGIVMLFKDLDLGAPTVSCP